MRVFRFSLGRVLDLRKQVEKEKALTMAEARKRSETAENTRDQAGRSPQEGRVHRQSQEHRVRAGAGRGPPASSGGGLP